MIFDFVVNRSVLGRMKYDLENMVLSVPYSRTLSFEFGYYYWTQCERERNESHVPSDHVRVVLGEFE